MPFTCRCSPEESLMHCDLSGPNDSRETCVMFRRMALDSCLEKGWGVLVDATRTRGTPTVEDIDLLVQTLDDVKGELTGRIAFVTGMWAPFGMARMLEIRAALVGVPFRAFMHETEAMAWLGRDTMTGAGDNDVSTSDNPYDQPASDLVRGLESDLAEMLGLAKGILADGVVTESEAVLLGRWMDAHPGIVGGWPGSVLSRRLRQIFEDGIVTNEECQDLALLLEELLGGKIGIMRGGATALPLDDPRPVIEVKGKVFALTGRFAFGSAQTCAEAIQEAGGSCVEAISQHTDYFVIGTFGAKNWIHSNWGREIATAVEYRRHYGRPFIVAEDYWVTAM